MVEFEHLESLEKTGAVRFTLGDVTNKSKKEIDKAKLNVLNAILQGKFKPMAPIGDSKGKKK